MYPSQRSFGDYLRPAASIHLHVTSQGQPILVTSSLALEDPEVNRGLMAAPLVVRNFHLRLAAFPFGFGFLDDISVEVLIQYRFICSVQCRVPLSFSEYHISGAVKRLSQWVVYEVRHS